MKLLLFFLTITVVMIILPTSSLYAQEVDIKTPVQANCEDSIEGEFTNNFEQHQYIMNLAPGDSLEALAVPFGDQLSLTLSVIGPTGLGVAVNNGNILSNGLIGNTDLENQPTVNTGRLSARGSYNIIVENFDTFAYSPNNSGGVGVYTLYITCTLHNSQVSETLTPEPEPVPCNYCFPTVESKDFSTGIEIPLQLSQPQTAPISAEGDTVAIYTYEATANSTATLSISRVSGNLSIGVAVINKADNSLIFLGGLPASNNLSAELTFPTEGTYAIGVFRLDTINATGTSGAVQVTLE